MKNLLLSLILICCFFIGYYIKNYYLNRKNFYFQIYYFIQSLINNISYNNIKLTAFVLNKKLDSTGNYKLFLVCFDKYLKNEITKEDFYKKLSKSLYFLNNLEVKVIIDFFTSIGEKTKDEELEYLNNFLHNLKQKTKTLEENYNKFANLYLKLFIILGIAIFIIFI